MGWGADKATLIKFGEYFALVVNFLKDILITNQAKKADDRIPVFGE